MIAPIMPPFMPAANPPPPAPAHHGFVKRGGWWVCKLCSLEESYCRCASRVTEAPPALDGAASTLNARERELKATR
jgi:hypothetical protein